MTHTKNAFTLVELLVVITVVAILATIATVYFFDNIGDGRDASRKSNFALINENLELFFTQESRYPIPDDSVDILYNGSVAWSQWEFWENVARKIKNFWSDIPTDPLYDNYFSYSITNNASEYQIAAILEWDTPEEWLGEIAFTPSAHAALERALVNGNYNNLMVRAVNGGENYFIATPSIISTDISIPDARDIITQRKLVYNDFFNLPASYSGSLNLNGWFNFNVADPLVFSGSIDELKTKSWIENFAADLRFVYATTPTESFDRYISILQEDGLFKLKSLLEKDYRISFSEPFDCREILDLWVADGNREYLIDPDGNGPLWEERVFCDMETWGWGWTRVWENHLSNGNFSSWADIESYYSTFIDTPDDNTIVAISNPAGWFALHQTGDNESNYEVHFDDLSILEVGQEVRLSAWVADSDGLWSNKMWLNPQAWYIFHNRINYSDGTFSTNGEVYVLDTVEVDWKLWQLQQVRHTVKKEPVSFQWYIWLDSEDSKDLYVAWVSLEVFYGGYDNDSLSEPIISYLYNPNTVTPQVSNPVLLDILWLWNNAPWSDSQDVIDSLVLDGHTVTFSDDSVTNDANDYDVVFIHEDVNSGTAWNNLQNTISTTAWIVTSETHLFDNIFWLPTWGTQGETFIDIINNTHPITENIASTGNFEMWSRRKVINGLTSWLTLGNAGSNPSFAVWESGDDLQGNIWSASWKRAIIPVDNDDWSMNTNMKELLKRTILWAGWAL